MRYNLRARLYISNIIKRHSRQCISINGRFSLSVVNCEIKISQVTYPAKACGVKLCRRQDISKRIIICVHFEAWGVIKVISKLVTDGPL